MKHLLLALFCLATGVAADTIPLGFENAVWRSGARILGQKKDAVPGLRYKIAHDGRAIRILAEMDEPSLGAMRVKSYSPGSGHIWMNDSIEINLVPDSRLKSFCKLIIDAAGQTASFKMVDDNTNCDNFRAFAWHVEPGAKVGRGKNKWTVDVSIPFGSLPLNEGFVTSRWRFNIGRNRYAANRAEYSATSDIPVANHVFPKAFQEFELKNWNQAEYKTAFGQPETRIRKNAGAFDISIATDVFNHTGNYRRFVLEAVLIDRDGRRAASTSARFSIPSSLFRNVPLGMKMAKSGEFTLALNLYASGSSPLLLRTERFPLAVEYSPLRIRLENPAYRDNIYATMPDKTVAAVIALEEGAGSPLTVTLANEDGKVVFSRSFPAAKAEERISCDMSKLPCGRYKLTAALTNGAATAKTIRNLPYRKGEVWLDRSGVVHIDGQKVLPFGWYGGIPEKKSVWINNSYTWGQYMSPDEFDRRLAELSAAGIYTYVMPWQESAKQKLLKEPDMRKSGVLSAAQRDYLTCFITAASRNNGLLGWYMADEPEGRDNNPKWYEDAYALLREVDPWHPCIMLNWGIDGMNRFYKSCDILMPDCYVQYFEDGSTGKPLWSNSDYAQTSTALRPSFQMPLMTVWPSLSSDGKKRGVAPDYDQQRSQFFQALIHDVKGFSMYSYFESQLHSELIIGPERIGETLYKCRDLLLADTRKDMLKTVTSPAADHFQSGLKRTADGKICLLAVETDGKKVNCTFTLKNAPPVLYVAGENRSVTLRNGSFSDQFNPGETHIYLDDKKLACSVPSVQGTRDEIAAFRKSRKRPGNLAGTGELFLIDYTRFAEGKIPENVARLKASSDSRMYHTLQTGSLYFLLDGLRFPNREEYAWAPTTGDKKPFVEITLPRESDITLVKLFTPSGNLRAGRVVANGTAVPFANPDGKPEITVSLPKTRARTVRVECGGFVKKNQTGVNSRLLNEIEIY